MAAAAPGREPVAVSIRPAEEGDAPALFALINEAYGVETDELCGAAPPPGRPGPLGFKSTLRLCDADAELLPLIRARTVLAAVASGGALAGCIAFAVGEGRLHFGPFAVAPAHQGCGVGGALLRAVYAIGARAGCACVEIEVVNHRTDILPMYEGALGYVRVGEAPFPAPERATRPCHFVLLRRPLAHADGEGGRPPLAPPPPSA